MSATEHSGSTGRSRREALQLAGMSAAGWILWAGGAVAEETELLTYNGPVSLGFRFSYPLGWKVKKKPIKTHLSEVIVTSGTEGSTTVGLVVDAVKIGGIESFGTAEMVGRKVVGMEERKESVSNASLVGTSAVSEGGLTYYVIEYMVESSRGAKRYLAKATISGGMLYVFTAQAKVEGFEGARETLERMVESFAVQKQYL